MSKKEIKPICFYLPQFHPIPENDEAHGEGFTEWTNVKKAYPLYDGHNQPRVPYDNNYYSLLDKEVMIQQAELAKKYGIYGFCYYHYWFKNGKKLLEKPVEMMLENKDIDIPFCLSWANENWTRRWDGGNHEIIVEQDYDDLNDLKKHVDYLCQFFKDDRYIKIDGKPLLLIYKPELIPNLTKTMEIIRNRARKNGFEDLEIIVQFPKFLLNNHQLELFDGFAEFQPIFEIHMEKHERKNPVYQSVKYFLLKVGARNLVQKLEIRGEKKAHKKALLDRRDYDATWTNIINRPIKNNKMIAGAFVDWDNTARNKNGRVFDGANPEKFECYMRQLIEKIQKEYQSEIVFINAWNEWAEGAYLEPDKKYGYGYLEALKTVIDETR
ncbi:MULTISPECIES: glycoside hydrolase family 99-like domain-containing protein [Streptococcus]|uniref:glycosyltransferase WbsX family protein n=1 Tax=Streptococcus TaxID=1301 RepID=UPI0011061974|nr:MULTISPECIES: glycoside hydrolase family 99-like domain-containing protein [Streptococcus]